MFSFNDMSRIYKNTQTIGQELKEMSDEVIQETWDNDIQSKLCYLYDYYHDDQFDEGLSGYNPSKSKLKIPVKAKFIVKEYKSASKDDPEYHVQFEPSVWNSMSFKPQWFIDEYEKYGINFPISLYIDIPDDRGVYHKWLIFYDEIANQFPKFGIIRCNYKFQWIEDDGVNRYKRNMWGTQRTQNSYTSCGIEIYNMARCIWKHCSVFLRICWDTLRAVIPKQKDEIYLNGWLRFLQIGQSAGKFRIETPSTTIG